jgi:hypothetical protein
MVLLQRHGLMTSHVKAPKLTSGTSTLKPRCCLCTSANSSKSWTLMMFHSILSHKGLCRNQARAATINMLEQPKAKLTDKLAATAYLYLPVNSPLNRGCSQQCAGAN